ncbi:GNAT family N-acetyltransferase, partial [Haloquadratum walsbyi]
MPFETPSLIPPNTPVPQQITTDSFIIRPLRITDTEADYAAVIESREQIKNTFGPDHPWPPVGLTLEQNRVDLAWHQKEHQRRDSFTFTIYDPDTETELGCLYIQPTQVAEYNATVYFWTSVTADRRNLTTQIVDI